MRRLSHPWLLSLDVLLAGLTYVGAYLIRLDSVFYDLYWPVIARTTPLVMVIAAVAFLVTDLYRSLPRYASLDTLIAVARSCTMAVALAALVIFLVWRGASFPRSVPVIHWMLMFLALSGVRILPRLRSYQTLLPLGIRRAERVPVLIYGAGDAGALVVREILTRPDMNYWPVGFIDDDERKRGRTVHGKPVLGTGKDLARVAREGDVEEVLVAIPSASGAQLRRIVDRCKEQLPGAAVKTLPALADLIEGRVSVTEFHRVRIEDLLKRSPRDLDPGRVREFVADKDVLVTGAGGSIGSELCRQVAACGPARLILFEQSEYNLYAIDRELAEGFPHLPRRAVLGDVSHRSSVEPVVREERPHILFHAAAYKHVPLLEENPCEGVANNVLGVLNTAEAADGAGVEHFIFVSTDKAVRPVSVMGAAKRVGEIKVQLMADRSRTNFNVVRFGNVLGSSGSVIPKFTDLISRGLPVPITDPRVTRYFMLTSEAVQLVMQAASLERSGDIFVLDMGEPVSIQELARDLAYLMGAGRDGEVEFEYTGLRPGEKLEEELVIQPVAERPTGFDSILVEGYRSDLDWAQLRGGLDRLVQAARSGEVDDTIRALADLVPEYRPATSSYRAVPDRARSESA